jgi:hypothetical protein
MTIQVVTYAERPELVGRGPAGDEVWPEYNLHGDVVNQWWGLLGSEFEQFQFLMYDEETDTVLAEGHTAPLAWDGCEETLPDSFDAVLETVFSQRRTGQPVNTLCALAAEIPPQGRGTGLARQLLLAMGELGRHNGLRHLVAPVRPSWKERYPLTPIERYIRWRRDDGQLLDPWMRVHERLGARVGRPLPRSLRITGTVAEWEAWTGLVFPESGEYVFPEGLATVHIDRGADLGLYWEPNVWVVHPDLSTGFSEPLSASAARTISR